MCKTPREVQLEKAANCDQVLLARGHPQELCHLEVLHKIRSEAKVAKRNTLKSLDMQDVMQLCIDDSKLADPFVREVSIPLRVQLYSKKQLGVVKRERPVILHMDSTGPRVLNPPFLEKEIIFYYSIVYRASRATIPIAEMITSQHDITSISIFLKSYRTFVLKTCDSWPLANARVTDWSWALMNSIMSEWNFLKMDDYLQISWKYFENRVVPQKLTIILIQYA